MSLPADTREALIAAIELRDQSTAAHTWRVVLYTRALAEAAGKSQEEIGRLSHAAALHDVGKLGISSAILCKRGPLDDKERAAMQRHPVLGYELLTGMGEDDPVVLNLVRHHHEQWDGGGYPDRLKGEEIDEAARCFAVVDCFDAMTGIRPYRAEVGPEAAQRAIAELKKGAGTRYWPEAVDRFTHLHDTGQLDWIREYYNDAKDAVRFGPVDLAGMGNAPESAPAP